jgi:hypothetical protein
MQLEENLLQRVNSLVQSSDLDFWRKGRFLVRTGSKLVSYKAGMCKLVNCMYHIYFCAPAHWRAFFGVCYYRYMLIHFG